MAFLYSLIHSMVCGAGGKYVNATRLTQPQREADILHNSWYFARHIGKNIMSIMVFT